LGLVPKANSKDEDTQAYLYIQQSENLSDVGITTNYNQLQQCNWAKSYKVILNKGCVVGDWVTPSPVVAHAHTNTNTHAHAHTHTQSRVRDEIAHREVSYTWKGNLKRQWHTLDVV